MRAVLLVSMILLLSLQVMFPEVNAGATPTLSNSTVQNGQTGLMLPSGASLYVYGLATGGAFPTGPFANGEYASVDDVDGYVIAAIAISTNNTNSYTTDTAYHNIGGASVSGSSSYTASSGSDGSSNARSASDTFTVTISGSLVVVLALAGGEQCQTLSGIPNLTIDATNNETSGLPVVVTIAHVYSSAGTYTVTEHTTQCASGQDPNHAGDLVGVVVFSTTSTLEPAAPLFGLNPVYLVSIAALAAVAILTLAIYATRSRRIKVTS